MEHTVKNQMRQEFGSEICWGLPELQLCIAAVQGAYVSVCLILFIPSWSCWRNLSSCPFSSPSPQGRCTLPTGALFALPNPILIISLGNSSFKRTHTRLRTRGQPKRMAWVKEHLRSPVEQAPISWGPAGWCLCKMWDVVRWTVTAHDNCAVFLLHHEKEEFQWKAATRDPLYLKQTPY